MQKPGPEIGEILIAKGCITRDQLNEALSEQELDDRFLGTILREKGFVSDDDLSRAMAEQFGLPFVELAERHIDFEVTGKFSASLVTESGVVPFEADDECVTVAVTNPMDAPALARVEKEAAPRSVRIVMVSEGDLRRLVDNYRRYTSQNIQRLLKRHKP